MKKCSKCGIEKPVAEYGMESVNEDNHILLCAGCHVQLHGECAL